MKNFSLLALGAVVGAVIALLAAGPRDRGAAPSVPEARSSERSSTPESLDDETVRKRFFEIWGRQFRDKTGIWKSTWLGVPTLQNPLDVWVTQEIFFEVKPDFVVETGTFNGGSAALWATILEQINPDARVITIDIKNWSAEARKLPIVQRRVDFLLGSSTDPAIVADVARRVAGKRVVVILDSLHKRDHVLAELEAYAPLVPVGSYIIVQDTGIGVPTYGMGWSGDAARDFLAKRDDFEADLTRDERFLITNNAHGFLKRVR